ncbi:MAG: hypothetical protein AB1724_08630 [Thermodesulfobacteriota bacterium]
MKKIPSHYTGRTRPVRESITIYGKYSPYRLDSTFSHIICNCGNNLFTVFLSDYPEVKCACSECGEEILMYDVSCYPDAEGCEPDKGKFSKWVSDPGKDRFELIAIWIYPDYPDHQDDIDWFVLITIDPDTREYTEIINYQTL